MKRRFAIILAVMMLLTSAFALNTMSLTANAADEEIVWEEGIADFSDAKWLTGCEDPDATERDLSKEPGLGYTSWGRSWVGHKITSDETDGQYLLDYYKENYPDGYTSDDMNTLYYEMPMDDWSNFAMLTSNAKPGQFKFEIKLKKGDTWVEGDNEFDLFIMFWTGNQWTLKQDLKEPFLNGTPDDKGWTNVVLQFEIPEQYNGIDSVQVLFRHRKVATRQLKIQRMVMATPINTADLPEVTPAAVTFDGSAVADVTVDVALKGFRLSNLRFKGQTQVLKKANYALSDSDTKLTLKKEFLQTLENGEYTIQVTTVGGVCEFVLTVQNNVPVTDGGNNDGGNGGNTDTPAPSGGCGGIITATSAVLASALLAGAMLVFKKKED